MNKYLFFAISVIFFSPFSAFGNVAITEVMYNPVGPDAGREWVEVTNEGTESVDISNWKFSNFGQAVSLSLIQGGSILNPLQTAIITNDQNQFLIDNPSFSGNLFYAPFSLSNSIGPLSILDENSRITDSVSYSSSWGAEETEESLQYDSDLIGWIPSLPTPGAIYHYNGEEVPWVNVAKSITWSQNENPHIVKATLVFNKGLNIESGSEIKFNNGTGLVFIPGPAVNILGEKTKYIVFTSNEASPQPGDYEGLYAYGNSNVSIKYAEFHFAKKAIDFEGAKLSIDNVLFKDNRVGVNLGNGKQADIKNSIFISNKNGIVHNNGFFQAKRISDRIFAFLINTAKADENILSKILIYNNSFKNNLYYSIVNHSGNDADLIDARNNYWNSTSGPTYYSNPTGTGDAVSDNVVFSPWLTSEPVDEPSEPPCTVNCNSSVMFLPGVMGSRLFENGDERWVSIFDSDHERLKLDENGKSVNNLYTKEVDGVIDDVYSANIYQSFMNNLDDWKNDENLIEDYALVPYDWRLSLNDILENGATTTGGKIFYGTNQGFQNSYIYKKLKELAGTSRTQKVTIVAHSNGGLVAKALIQKLKEVNDPLYEAIDNLILVAVPQSGTPDAINILLHGDNIGKGFIMETARMRDMAHNMPGAYQLLPSLAYWNGKGSAVQTPIVTFEPGASTQSFIDTYGTSIGDASTLRRFLLGEDSRFIPAYGDLNNPSRLNETLLNNARDAHTLIDDAWVPSVSTTIYQIAGWGEETLATLKYKTLSKCVTAEWRIVGWKLLYECSSWKNTLTVEPDEFVDGDGVVVTPSALAISTSSSMVKRLWVNLQKYDTIFNYEREHRDILEIPDIGGFIKNTISTTTLKTYEFIENSEPLAGSTKRLSFILHSPLDLIIRDSSGNEVSSTTESISGGRYKRYGEVQYISVPEDSNPTLFLQGISSGSFDLDIRESVGNNIVATTTFASIPSATSTTVSMSFTDGTIENASVLSIDYQGDGQVDETIEPVVGETVTLPPLDLLAPEGRVIFSTSTDSVDINGFDDKTLNPVIISTATSSTITDETGNVIKLTRTVKNNKNNASFVLSKLEYSTSTKTNVVISATSNYLWLKTSKPTAYLVFASFLKTSTENLVSVYDSVKKKTIIYSLPKGTTSVDINSFVLKPLRGAIVKTMLNGMIIPYLETNKGQVLIKY